MGKVCEACLSRLQARNMFFFSGGPGHDYLGEFVIQYSQGCSLVYENRRPIFDSSDG